MTSDTLALVQSSFAKVIPLSETAAALFYARLFEIAPEVRPFFRGDIKDQGRKLMTTLTVLVNNLKHLEAILPGVEELARRHVAFGVEPEHYAKVGAALLYTLERALGEAFTPATRDAWAETYATVSAVMIAAAYGPGSRASAA